MQTTTLAIIIVIVLILIWLILLLADAYFGFFIFSSYAPPPLSNAFQPVKEEVPKNSGVFDRVPE